MMCSMASRYLPAISPVIAQLCGVLSRKRPAASADARTSSLSHPAEERGVLASREVVVREPRPRPCHYRGIPLTGGHRPGTGPGPTGDGTLLFALMEGL